MATQAVRKAKNMETLPKLERIIIRDRKPCPEDAEVTPDGGRVIFENKDRSDHRIRFWKAKTDPASGIDLLLPAGGKLSVLIKKDDDFQYYVMNVTGEGAMTGGGGGGIRN